MNIKEKIKLKEQISTLEDLCVKYEIQCAKSEDKINELMCVPNNAHCLHKIINMMCEEQIKAQRDEESTQMKMKDVESFARYLSAMTSISIKFLEDKYNIK